MLALGVTVNSGELAYSERFIIMIVTIVTITIVIAMFIRPVTLVLVDR